MNDTFIKINGVYLYYIPCCDDKKGFVETTASHLTFGGFCHNDGTDVQNLLASHRNKGDGKLIATYELSRGTYGWVVIKRTPSFPPGETKIEWTRTFKTLDEAIMDADYDVYFSTATEQEIVDLRCSFYDELFSISPDGDEVLYYYTQSNIKVINREISRRKNAKETK